MAKSPRSTRRIISAGSVAALLGSLLLWVASPSLAVDDTGRFELDGNIVDDTAAGLPHDWAGLFDASGNQLVAPGTDGLIASTFLGDVATPDSSYFESNKDIEPVADWACGPVNNPTNKDDLVLAAAALVEIPVGAPDNAGHTVLYLASARDSNNGTSYAGYWLLKDPNVTCSSPGGFAGQHTDGDLLIVADFTNGGGSQSVTVYRWTGNDATGSPVQVATGGICASGGTADNQCVLANTATITSPWAPTSLPTNQFVETGIDLTVLLGSSGGCFSRFLAETRSSDQLTATLSDYADGSFTTCPKAALDTTAIPAGSLLAPGPANQHDVATVSAVGAGPAPTGTVTFFLCGPAQVTGAGCPSGGVQVGAPITVVAGSATSANASGATTTPAGKYCWRAEYAPDAAGANFYTATRHTNATTECFTVANDADTDGDRLTDE